MEGDQDGRQCKWVFAISIHSLRMEGDSGRMIDSKLQSAFQSTPSAWRETVVSSPNTPYIFSFQSTPSAWRETEQRGTSGALYKFQSTPSAWRETYDGWGADMAAEISIHSLRMEGDTRNSLTPEKFKDFNPLPPHGGRPPRGSRTGTQGLFQSTPSAWRETFFSLLPHLRRRHFNPLPPHGGRLGQRDSLPVCFFLFQSTPSAWRETLYIL